MRADPGLEGSVHLAEAIFSGEVVVGEHEVTVLGDERGVVDCGAAEGGHGLMVAGWSGACTLLSYSVPICR
jgi:hypothetical protein